VQVIGGDNWFVGTRTKAMVAQVIDGDNWFVGDTNHGDGTNKV